MHVKREVETKKHKEGKTHVYEIGRKKKLRKKGMRNKERR